MLQVRAAEEETAGGVFLPDKAQEKPTEGVVAGLGPGRIHPETGVVIPIPVEQGEHVLYGKYDGKGCRVLQGRVHLDPRRRHFACLAGRIHVG